MIESFLMFELVINRALLSCGATQIHATPLEPEHQKIRITPRVPSRSAL